MKHTVLIAGGTGLIGKRLNLLLNERGHSVRILSRNPKGSNHYYWNPSTGEINEESLKGVTCIVNLSGANLAEGRWTKKRKKELESSRVQPNKFLFSLLEKMPELQHFVCSSGINCYGYDSGVEHSEKDDFGTDYLSQLVKVWEESADLFSGHCKVSKVRTAVVLDNEGGAFKKLVSIIRLGVGSGLGSGNQYMPWIHYYDLSSIYVHIIENGLEGCYNAVAGSVTNQEFMKKLAQAARKPFFFPRIPALVLKVMLGEMSSMLLQGTKASNSAIKRSGLHFNYENLEDAFQNLLNP